MIATLTDTKRVDLEAILKGMGRVLIAYSGGVDSTYLMYVAHQVLRDDCVVATAISPSYTREEQERAQHLASQMGVRHILVETHEMDDPNYVKNAPNRCYFCKKELFSSLWPIAAKEGIETIAYGAITDDLGDFRPGHEAAREFKIRSPLVEAGLSKKEIRELSAEADLPTHDLPSGACLSSRFAYGNPIVAEKLRGIETAEKMLRDAGMRTVRVRHHGTIARIEVEAKHLALLAESDVRLKIIDHLKGMGYIYVTVDLQGFRSGSMNEALRRQPSPDGSTAH